MAKECSGCKREITWGGANCPYCGNSQNRFKSWLLPLALVGVSVTISLFLAHKYYASAIKQAEADGYAQAEAERFELSSSLKQLQQDHSSLQTEFDRLDDELKQAKSAGNDEATTLQLKVTELQQALADANADVEKQTGRAGWLGRENTRLKNEIETLKEQVASLQATLNQQTENSLNNTNTPTDIIEPDQPPTQDEEDDGPEDPDQPQQADKLIN